LRKRMKSLLIVGLPRSLTSKSYKIACESLENVLTPCGANAGEILNYQPKSPSGMTLETTGPFYSQDPKLIDSQIEYIMEFRNNYIVKDVVQPFVIKALRERHPEAFNILRIDRMIQDVTYAMTMREWWYPLRAVDEDLIKEAEKSNGIDDKLLTAFINSLREAATCYDRLPKVTFHSITKNEDAIPKTLREMGYQSKQVNYVTKRFKATRTNRFDNRKTPYWKRIDKLFKESK